MANSSQQAALREVRLLMASGIEPTVFGLLPDHADLVDELVDACGSFAGVRHALKLPKRSRREWTEEDVLDDLRRLHACGVTLTPKRLRVLGEEMLLKACYERFGSIPDARAAAGVGRDLRKPVINRRIVLAVIYAAAGRTRAASPTWTSRSRSSLPLAASSAPSTRRSSPRACGGGGDGADGTSARSSLRCRHGSAKDDPYVTPR
ncbi:MAG: hypothetical protein KIT31_26330 [Deltaproteobacteria bacterium]|nr:hypothetical protein [Deltaproteobacteria bacterium]